MTAGKHARDIPVDELTPLEAASELQALAREIARHFDFAKHFKVIYGSELDGTRTNKVELIAHLLEQEHLDPAQTLMIGDRKHDLIGARSNGLESVAVGYGFGSEEEILAENPTYHFATLAELPAKTAPRGPFFVRLRTDTWW